jgi:HAD superfamily hydrolase (TIGR01549 family)
MMEAILFDFGGTLDTNGIHWSEKFWALYTFFGIPVLKYQYEEAYRYSEKLMVERTEPGHDMRTMLSNQIQFQFDFLRDRNWYKADELTIKEMVFDCWEDILEQTNRSRRLLQLLKGYYRLGLVSNFTGNLVAVVKSLSLDENFDVLVDSHIVNIAKPDPRIFLYALEKLNITPDKSFMIGDSYDRDIQPSKSIGCSTIWLDGQSWKKHESVTDADFIIGDLEDIKTIVF